VYLIGAIHLALAVLALVCGLLVTLGHKGDGRHRTLGRIYFVSMLGVNVTALMIYRLFGAFGPFHAAALLSLATVLAGFVTLRRRRPRKKWLEHHAMWMSWSYVGLLAAAVAEITTRLPRAPFWWVVLASTFVTVGIGNYLVKSRVPGAIARLRSRGA